VAEKINPYKVLGVDQNASQDEIKKAYRRLAKALHPDVNKAPNAEEEFQVTHDAYTLLSDPETRAAYDENVKNGGRTQYQFAFQDVFDMFFSRPQTADQPINGENLKTTVEFTVFEALNGAEKQAYVPRKRLCPDCHGKRFVATRETCSDCGGSGHKEKIVSTPLGRISSHDRCPTCNGYGKKKAVPCTTCEESGLVPDDAKVLISLPPGTHDGFVMRYLGKGQPGRDGGKDGDLLVTFVHQKSDRFKLENTFDVVTNYSVTLKDALVGGQAKIVFPQGPSQTVSIDRGVSNGDRIAFADLGLIDPKTGNSGIFYVEFSVNIPHMSYEQASKIAQILNE
jgi:molecular chaperone DnaJ